MKIVLGLGNPGDKYKRTRHNAGFIFAEKFVDMPQISPVDQKLNFKKMEKLSAEVVETSKDGEKIVVAKPLTFMNSSGDAAMKLVRYFGAEFSDLVVVHDDIDIQIGRVKIAKSDGSAGHKGVQDIINKLKTKGFSRVRIGIEGNSQVDAEATVPSDNQIDTRDYVLAKFAERELNIIDAVCQEASEHLLESFGKKKPLLAHTLTVREFKGSR